MKNRRRLFLAIGVFLMLFCGKVFASQAVITDCKINTGDKTKVIVHGTVSGNITSSDDYYYLFALLPYENQVSKDSYLAARIKKTSVFHISCSLNLNNRNSTLYRKFVLAVKSGNGYRVTSNAMYITNPECLAKVTTAFPKAASKKGLHIKPSMIQDAEDLGIKHAAVNICLDLFITGSSSQKSSKAVPYTYQGKKYWFSKVGCNEVDSQVKKLSDSGVIVSGILLLRQNGAGKILVAPNARNKGKAYYGFNTMNREGCETLEALMHFLGDRYMNSGGSHGTIVNWIVGNEVNNYNDYNYLGNLSFDEYVAAYTRSFRICDVALRSVYSKARVYISLDHLWNLLQPHGKCYTSKSMLDAFAETLKREGDLNWNLAFHPYPSPLTDPVFWDDNVSNSDSTKQVTMKNLGYLTDYVSTHFRKDVRVILSEQGFTSKTGGVTNEKLQAAAYAYAYYITEFNDKVDSFIMNRHVDHKVETNQGLFLGIWTNKKGNLEYADSKKEIYDVFKYIDSSGSKQVTDFALTYLPGKTWESMISGFNWNRFKNMGGYTNGKGVIYKKASKTKSISNNLKYNYNGTANKKGSKTYVSTQTATNPNMYTGAGWKFTKKLNFNSYPYFTCTINVSGMKESYAHVRLRFFSGKEIYEATLKQKGGGTRKVSVKLSNWSGKGSVDKIQIWVRPYGKSKWKSGGKITIDAMKQAKSTS